MESQSDRIVVSQQADVSIVEFVDSKLLDEVHIVQIGEALAAMVAGEENPLLVVDFSNVAHMSSSALGMLITLHKQVREHGGRVALCNVRPEIYQVFTITKLSDVFQIYDSRTTALAGLA